jgi:hypothetical protein
MINIVCLKWGTRYSAEWVNRLYTMVKKNYSGPFTFSCCTEDPEDLDLNVQVIKLPEQYDLEKWWWKLWILSEEFPIKGKCLFFDLDTVIQNDITELVEFDNKDNLYMLLPQWRRTQLGYQGITYRNSSVMLWNSITINPDYFNKFIINYDYYILKYNADENFIETIDMPKYLPVKWFYSRFNGYDNTNTKQLLKSNGHISIKIKSKIPALGVVWYKPERMICLFNGFHGDEISQEEKDVAFNGFEKYFTYF